ncbi:Kae1-associated kinase Bud32 [Thermofilum pendens]|uniref:non-specific serine/threonine protein kinase n=1 Tax=Thermofilum pendens (strain DSM 2475 / Hrk 5) TaxID=368408 RepID=A1RXD2_THEPD|nr:Kae1-associated kinase Bud32 [Thermofilum pendens]ABL77862.1 Mn2+-dependent serine/threonine protein kinase [Thermofilum pendens Hrk 5]
MRAFPRDAVERLERWLGFRAEGVLGFGAEAVIVKGELAGEKVVVKYRVPKSYRDPRLDSELRRERTVLESRILSRAAMAGVNVPVPVLVYPEEGILVMTYIGGERLKDSMRGIEPGTLRNVFVEIGRQLGTLHSLGIVYGDLTTSNVILSPTRTPWLVDFGLGFFSNRDEDAGVDLHLFKRALESTHPLQAEDLFQAFVDGYAQIRGRETAEKILAKMREIRLRGRYVKERRARLSRAFSG